MTMPHLMNCEHSSDGWCLDCVKQMYDRIETLEFTANMLYDINGDQRKTIRYLLDKLGVDDGALDIAKEIMEEDR